jgi:hypothetical protein
MISSKEKPLDEEDWKLIILAVDASDNDEENDKVTQDLYDALEHKLCLMFPEVVKQLQEETKIAAKFEEELR